MVGKPRRKQFRLKPKYSQLKSLNPTHFYLKVSRRSEVIFTEIWRRDAIGKAVLNEIGGLLDSKVREDPSGGVNTKLDSKGGSTATGQ